MGRQHQQLLRLGCFGVTGLRFLQPCTHSREMPALVRALLVSCKLRAPCSHALDAEWKSFVSHDRYFSPYPFY